MLNTLNKHCGIYENPAIKLYNFGSWADRNEGLLTFIRSHEHSPPSYFKSIVNRTSFQSLAKKSNLDGGSNFYQWLYVHAEAVQTTLDWISGLKQLAF